MVIGCYYLTTTNITNLKNSNHYFSSLDDVLLALDRNVIDLHASIWVRHSVELPLNENLKVKVLSDGSKLQFSQQYQIHLDKDESIISSFIRTTPGRVLMNKTIMNVLDKETTSQSYG